MTDGLKEGGKKLNLNTMHKRLGSDTAKKPQLSNEDIKRQAIQFFGGLESRLEDFQKHRNEKGLSRVKSPGHIKKNVKY